MSGMRCRLENSVAAQQSRAQNNKQRQNGRTNHTKVREDLLKKNRVAPVIVACTFCAYIKDANRKGSVWRTSLISKVAKKDKNIFITNLSSKMKIAQNEAVKFMYQ